MQIDRDKELAEYVEQLERSVGGLVTEDFVAGVKHGLEVVAAYDEPVVPGHVRAPVRVAAKMALERMR